jgi:hypothetical protein
LSSLFGSLRRIGLDLLPLEVRASQERNRVRLGLRLLDGVRVSVLVRNVSLQHERSGVQRGLEGALSRSHSAAHRGLVEHAHRLHSLLCDRMLRGVLTEEFRVSHR